MRDAFHAENDRLLDTLLEMGDAVFVMLDRAVQALTTHDTGMAEEVIRADDYVDARYVDVQNRVVRQIALQAPVASDLRLLSSMIHVSIHLERMGDYAVTVAKMAKLSASYRDDPELLDQLREMAEFALHVGREAIAAYAHRDLVTSRRLPDLDDSVDQLNIGVFRRLVQLAARDESRLEWATHMILVARQLERWSDHAVDIGEATIYAATGQLVELGGTTPATEEARAITP